MVATPVKKNRKTARGLGISAEPQSLKSLQVLWVLVTQITPGTLGTIHSNPSRYFGYYSLKSLQVLWVMGTIPSSPIRGKSFWVLLIQITSGIILNSL